MRFPPDEWTIRLDELFDPTVGDGSTSKLSAEVLVQVDNTARINGCFKVVLSGADTLKLDLPEPAHHGGRGFLPHQDGGKAPGHLAPHQRHHIGVVQPDGQHPGWLHYSQSVQRR